MSRWTTGPLAAAFSAVGVTAAVVLGSGLALADPEPPPPPAPGVDAPAPLPPGDPAPPPPDLNALPPAAARAQGHRLVVLVGDEPYYGKSGFVRVPKGRAMMPGPVDPARILVCELSAGAFANVAGPIRPEHDAQ